MSFQTVLSLNHFRLVLRILPVAQVKVQCQLGNKFGCHPNNVHKLLLKAKELDVNVMGVR